MLIESIDTSSKKADAEVNSVIAYLTAWYQRLEIDKAAGKLDLTKVSAGQPFYDEQTLEECLKLVSF